MSTEAIILTIDRFVTYSDASHLPESAFGGMGGFFAPGMRWPDYLDRWNDEAKPTLENLRKAIIENKIRCNGYQHQHDQYESCPVFSDGTCATYTFRAWGDLMAAVWSSEEDKDYSYMDFYC